MALARQQLQKGELSAAERIQVEAQVTRLHVAHREDGNTEEAPAPEPLDAEAVSETTSEEEPQQAVAAEEPEPVESIGTSGTEHASVEDKALASTPAESLDNAKDAQIEEPPTYAPGILRIAEELGFESDEIQLFDHIVRTLPPLEWFSRGAVTATHIPYKENVWKNVVAGLLGADILESNDKSRGGRKYRFTRQVELYPSEVENNEGNTVADETAAKSGTATSAGPEEPTTEPEVSTSPDPLPEDHESPRDEAQVIAQYITEYIEETGQNTPKAKSIIAHLIEKSGKTEAEVRQGLKRVSAAGHFHIASPNGVQIVRRGPSPFQRSEQASSKEATDPRAWTAHDVEISMRALAWIASNTSHASEGLSMKEVVHQIQSGHHPKAVVRGLRKLAARQLIDITPIVNPRLSGPRPDDDTVRLFNQMIRQRVIEDSTGLRKELQALVKTD